MFGGQVRYAAEVHAVPATANCGVWPSTIIGWAPLASAAITCWSSLAQDDSGIVPALVWMSGQ
jgi:hypothetical protein